MKFYAHVSETDENRKQTVYEHAHNVAEMAGEFADLFGAREEAEQIGLAHDIGKYSSKFQDRLLRNGTRVDHSTAGAAELWNRRNILGAFCVAGHHSGLPDMGTRNDTSDAPTLCGRVKRKQEERLPDYSAFAEEIELSEGIYVAGRPPFGDKYFRTKMLFSCLVDADFLDTEAFVKENKREQCSNDDMEVLWGKLSRKLDEWKCPTTELNRIRNEIRSQCIDAGQKARGLYSLTVPTGGGKTISSLAFALQHAVVHKEIKRIIYVIPYTSIIDQTVEEFEKILGKQNVLAHYGEVSYEDSEEASDAELLVKKRQATENWDVPVVVTTSVQFFESIYSNKTSKNRKVHNIANSVLIFDEYQMLPVKQMRPCTEAIYRMIKDYGCTALLCTATQPGTQQFFHKMECYEIIENVPALFEQLTRVTYRDRGRLTEESLAQILMGETQVLCIVNTRKSAQEIFRLLEGEGNFHLSTLMVPADRKNRLREIRERLKEQKICRVISTSLIEAGVDVDFPLVFREENGLDSIVQAAGRCNREGRRGVEESIVNVFSTEKKCPLMQRANRDARKETLQLGYELGTPQAVKKYFDLLFGIKGEDALDAEGVYAMCEKGIPAPFMFRTISEKFHMIDNRTKTVYVPYKEGVALTKRLAEGERTRTLFRELGKYGVNLYSQDYERLKNCGALLEYDEDAVILSDLSRYSEEMGLIIPEDEGYMGFFI